MFVSVSLIMFAFTVMRVFMFIGTAMDTDLGIDRALGNFYGPLQILRALKASRFKKAFIRLTDFVILIFKRCCHIYM
jgi:hypothetical protein